MPALINNRQKVMDDKHEMTSTDRPHRRVGLLQLFSITFIIIGFETSWCGEFGVEDVCRFCHHRPISLYFWMDICTGNKELPLELPPCLTLFNNINSNQTIHLTHNDHTPLC